MGGDKGSLIGKEIDNNENYKRVKQERHNTVAHRLLADAQPVPRLQ